MTSSTKSGWDNLGTWLLSVSKIVAPIRFATKRSNSGGMSLVASTGGLTLLPTYVQHALIPSVVARPFRGEAPTIDLMMGYSKSNTSPLLKRFLRADELVNRVFQAGAYSSGLKRGDRKPSV